MIDAIVPEYDSIPPYVWHKMLKLSDENPDDTFKSVYPVLAEWWAKEILNNLSEFLSAEADEDPLLSEDERNASYRVAAVVACVAEEI